MVRTTQEDRQALADAANERLRSEAQRRNSTPSLLPLPNTPRPVQSPSEAEVQVVVASVIDTGARLEARERTFYHSIPKEGAGEKKNEAKRKKKENERVIQNVIAIIESDGGGVLAQHLKAMQTADKTPVKVGKINIALGCFMQGEGEAPVKKLKLCDPSNGYDSLDE